MNEQTKTENSLERGKCWWLNIYPPETEILCHRIYETKELADKAAHSSRLQCLCLTEADPEYQRGFTDGIEMIESTVNYIFDNSATFKAVECARDTALNERDLLRIQLSVIKKELADSQFSRDLFIRLFAEKANKLDEAVTHNNALMTLVAKLKSWFGRIIIGINQKTLKKSEIKKIARDALDINTFTI